MLSLNASPGFFGLQAWSSSGSGPEGFVFNTSVKLNNSIHGHSNNSKHNIDTNKSGR